ncbi:MAG: sigma-70 family RNA polymerase sigma factor [Bacteroidetes bacterium]|nr:sigma-70 family RNA polymerase sigma factor [Bacteroidota bacterium]
MNESTQKVFEVLMESNRGILFKIVNMYAKEAEDKEDLAQEIRLQLWNSFGKYNPELKFTTWMYRIGLNVAISFFRKQQVRGNRFLPINEEPPDNNQNESEENDLKLKLLDRFISELIEIDKALLLLYLDKKSNQEIAEIMGLTTTNVSTKISRIKEKLKQRFSTYKGD